MNFICSNLNYERILQLRDYGLGARRSPEKLSSLFASGSNEVRAVLREHFLLFILLKALHTKRLGNIFHPQINEHLGMALKRRDSAGRARLAGNTTSRWRARHSTAVIIDSARRARPKLRASLLKSQSEQEMRFSLAVTVSQPLRLSAQLGARRVFASPSPQSFPIGNRVSLSRLVAVCVFLFAFLSFRTRRPAVYRVCFEEARGARVTPKKE